MKNNDNANGCNTAGLFKNCAKQQPSVKQIIVNDFIKTVNLCASMCEYAIVNLHRTACWYDDNISSLTGVSGGKFIEYYDARLEKQFETFCKLKNYDEQSILKYFYKEQLTDEQNILNFKEIQSDMLSNCFWFNVMFCYNTLLDEMPSVGYFKLLSTTQLINCLDQLLYANLDYEMRLQNYYANDYFLSGDPGVDKTKLRCDKLKPVDKLLKSIVASTLIKDNLKHGNVVSALSTKKLMQEAEDII